jgi:sulfate transport system ATP-binding protein
VYRFLGDVNLFHGRVHDGRTTIGDWQVPVPEGLRSDDGKATVYVRPHDLEILGARDDRDALKAVITQFAAVGPRVRVDLKRTDSGDIIHADIDKDRFLELRVGAGDHVAVRPRRHCLYPAAAA